MPLPGCCQCEGLTTGGLVAIIILVLLFWPLAWIPCCMPECYQKYQRPVYGNVAGAPPPAPYVPPPTGYPAPPAGVPAVV